MVFDAYSDFVNNHHLAMETVKTLARQKQGFADFLKVLKLTVLMSKCSVHYLVITLIQLTYIFQGRIS